MENRNRFSESNQKNTTKGSTSNVLKWILGAGVVIATAAAIYLGVNGNFFKTETERLQSELTELNDTKAQLETSLTDMEINYDGQIALNDSLSIQIEERVQEVEGLKKKLSSVRSQLASSKANSEDIRARLAQMEELKTALEADILTLKDQNAELMATTEQLNTDLADRQSMVENLNQQVAKLTETNQKISEHLYRVAPAGYRADNFSIVMKKKNDKITTKAKKVDEVKVSFNLDNVPTEKQGDGALYIAITNVLGETVKEIPASEVMVKGRMENLKINAVDAKEVNLKQTQSVDMSFNPGKDFKEGEYNLMVYSSDGYLGSTGFYLR